MERYKVKNKIHREIPTEITTVKNFVNILTDTSVCVCVCVCVCVYIGFLGSSAGKRIHLQCRRPWFNSWIGKILWTRAWQPIPVFLSGESP